MATEFVKDILSQEIVYFEKTSSGFFQVKNNPGNAVPGQPLYVLKVAENVDNNALELKDSFYFQPKIIPESQILPYIVEVKSGIIVDPAIDTNASLLPAQLAGTQLLLKINFDTLIVVDIPLAITTIADVVNAINTKVVSVHGNDYANVAQVNADGYFTINSFTDKNSRIELFQCDVVSILELPIGYFIGDLPSTYRSYAEGGLKVDFFILNIETVQPNDKLGRDKSGVFMPAIGSNGILKFLPEFDKTLVENNPRLRLLMDGYAYILERLDERTRTFLDEFNIDKVDEKFFRYLSATLGFDVANFPASEAGTRELVKNLVEIYRIKGTEKSFEIFFRYLGLLAEVLEHDPVNSKTRSTVLEITDYFDNPSLNSMKDYYERYLYKDSRFRNPQLDYSKNILVYGTSYTPSVVGTTVKITVGTLTADHVGQIFLDIDTGANGKISSYDSGGFVLLETAWPLSMFTGGNYEIYRAPVWDAGIEGNEYFDKFDWRVINIENPAKSKSISVYNSIPLNNGLKIMGSSSLECTTDIRTPLYGTSFEPFDLTSTVLQFIVDNEVTYAINFSDYLNIISNRNLAEVSAVDAKKIIDSVAGSRVITTVNAGSLGLASRNFSTNNSIEVISSGSINFTTTPHKPIKYATPTFSVGFPSTSMFGGSGIVGDEEVQIVYPSSINSWMFGSTVATGTSYTYNSGTGQIVFSAPVTGIQAGDVFTDKSTNYCMPVVSVVSSTIIQAIAGASTTQLNGGDFSILRNNEGTYNVFLVNNKTQPIAVSSVYNFESTVGVYPLLPVLGTDGVYRTPNYTNDAVPIGSIRIENGEITLVAQSNVKDQFRPLAKSELTSAQLKEVISFIRNKLNVSGNSTLSEQLSYLPDPLDTGAQQSFRYRDTYIGGSNPYGLNPGLSYKVAIKTTAFEKGITINSELITAISDFIEFLRPVHIAILQIIFELTAMEDDVNSPIAPGLQNIPTPTDEHPLAQFIAIDTIDEIAESMYTQLQSEPLEENNQELSSVSFTREEGSGMFRGFNSPNLDGHTGSPLLLRMGYGGSQISYNTPSLGYLLPRDPHAIEVKVRYRELVSDNFNRPDGNILTTAPTFRWNTTTWSGVNVTDFHIDSNRLKMSSAYSGAFSGLWIDPQRSNVVIKGKLSTLSASPAGIIFRTNTSLYSSLGIRCLGSGTQYEFFKFDGLLTFTSLYPIVDSGLTPIVSANDDEIEISIIGDRYFGLKINDVQVYFDDSGTPVPEIVETYNSSQTTVGFYTGDVSAVYFDNLIVDYSEFDSQVGTSYVNGTMPSIAEGKLYIS